MRISDWSSDVCSSDLVREAVANLSADGLVESRQGAGIFVCDRPAMAFASISQEIGVKVSHPLNVIEVRMGLDIESAALAAVRLHAAQEDAIPEIGRAPCHGRVCTTVSLSVLAV